MFQNSVEVIDSAHLQLFTRKFPMKCFILEFHGEGSEFSCWTFHFCSGVSGFLLRETAHLSRKPLISFGLGTFAVRNTEIPVLLNFNPPMEPTPLIGSQAFFSIPWMNSYESFVHEKRSAFWEKLLCSCWNCLLLLVSAIVSKERVFTHSFERLAAKLAGQPIFKFFN